MGSNSSVEHKGVVESIQGDKARVKFLSHSACASCYAKGACSISEVETKFVDVDTRDKQVLVGEEVTVSLKRALGMRAVLYGYILPLAVLLVTLILTILITNNELISALLSIGILIPYYIGLYLMRDRLSNVFHFVLVKN